MLNPCNKILCFNQIIVIIVYIVVVIVVAVIVIVIIIIIIIIIIEVCKHNVAINVASNLMKSCI